MPDWFANAPAEVRYAVLAAVVVIALVLIGSVMQRRREAAAWRRRRAELARTLGQQESRAKELEELAGQVVATSSTAQIAGYLLVRQIEAVFAEGQRSPAEAVAALKAQAASKGANALINLHSQRLPSGKCVASGDAVVVRPLDLDEEIIERPRGNGAGRREL